MRFCTKCYTCQSEENFGKCKLGHQGLKSACKSCRAIEGKIYKEKYPDKRKSQSLRSYYKHKSEINKRAKDKHAKNKEIIKIRATKYRNENREHVREIARTWYHANKKKVFDRLRTKRHTDSFFKLKCSLKKRVQIGFKKSHWRKGHNTLKLLGANYATVKKHIERQFKKGMSWDNYGRFTWHIDHIIPLASAKTEQELIELCHYTNLQPMWASENMAKSDKIPEVQIPLRL